MAKDILWDLIAWLGCVYLVTRWWKYQRMDLATRRKIAPGGGYHVYVRAPWLFLIVAAGLLAAAVGLLFEVIG